MNGGKVVGVYPSCVDLGLRDVCNNFNSKLGYESFSHIAGKGCWRFNVF